MSQAMATVLLGLTVAVALGLAFFSIRRFGTDNVVIYATLLALPPVAFWLVWVARGRGASLRTMLLVGACTGLIAAAVWRLRRWDGNGGASGRHVVPDGGHSAEGPRVKHFRYQVLAMTVVAPASAVIGGLAGGLATTAIIVLALVGGVGACLLSSLAWWLLRDRWRAQGWEW